MDSSTPMVTHTDLVKLSGSHKTKDNNVGKRLVGLVIWDRKETGEGRGLQ